MQKTQQESLWKKQQNFRVEIRRRQIDQLFRLQRHELPQNQSIQQQAKVCRLRFEEVAFLLGIIYDIDINYATSQQDKARMLLKYRELGDKIGNNMYLQRLQICLKQLRDLNCSHKIPQLFAKGNNLSVLLQLQKLASLDRQCQIFVHQMLLNISAYQPVLKNKQADCPIPSFTIDQLQLNLKYGNNRQVLCLLYQIVSNLLIIDSTSHTIYYLITKAHIFQHIVGFLADTEHRAIYQAIGIQPTFLYFVNKVIQNCVRFKFNTLDKQFNNVVQCQLAQLVIQSQEPNPSISVNHILLYTKTLLKTISTTELQLPEHFLKFLESHFDTNNAYYVNFLNTLTFETLYRLKLNHLKAILKSLLQQNTATQAKDISSNLVRCVSNSLMNDTTYWKVIMDYFVKYGSKYAQKHKRKWQNYLSKEYHSRQFQVPYTESDRTQLPQKQQNDSPSFLHYFLHFLRNPKTEYDMSQIIGILICGQGGLGIFQEGIETMLQSNLMTKKLIQLGYEL